MRKELILEYRDKFCEAQTTLRMGNVLVMITPPIDKDYWVFRVKLHKKQALLAFPKFGTIGIGFALETDWNTNLPYSCKAKDIYSHIEDNKRHDEITKSMCIEAIELLQKACEAYVKAQEENEAQQNSQAFNRYMTFRHGISPRVSYSKVGKS